MGNGVGKMFQLSNQLLQLGGAFGHQKFHLLFTPSQHLSRLPRVRHVGVGPKPPYHFAILVTQWYDPGQEPAVLSVGSAQGEFHFKRFP